ncbi:hypothetical protein HDU93_006151 [Gonapodya sp. JEL0774]|nr:hypothetical protein HDU93_006151 [Gonapodya sp. JEL0774]
MNPPGSSLPPVVVRLAEPQQMSAAAAGTHGWRDVQAGVAAGAGQIGQGGVPSMDMNVGIGRGMGGVQGGPAVGVFNGGMMRGAIQPHDHPHPESQYQQNQYQQYQQQMMGLGAAAGGAGGAGYGFSQSQGMGLGQGIGQHGYYESLGGPMGNGAATSGPDTGSGLMGPSSSFAQPPSGGIHSSATQATTPYVPATNHPAIAIHVPASLDPADLRRLLRCLPGFRRLVLPVSASPAASTSTPATQQNQSQLALSLFTASFVDADSARSAADVIAGLGHGIVSGTVGGPGAAGMWGGVEVWRGAWCGGATTPVPTPSPRPSDPPTSTLITLLPPPLLSARPDYYARLVSDHDGVIALHPLGTDSSSPAAYAVVFRDATAAARAARDLGEGTSIGVRYAREGEEIGSDQILIRLDKQPLEMRKGMAQTEREKEQEVEQGEPREEAMWEDGGENVSARRDPERERSGSRDSRRSSASVPSDSEAAEGEDGLGRLGGGTAGGVITGISGIKQRGRSHSQSSAHSAASASSAGGARVPRATVHITNLSAPGNGLDKADVKHLLAGYPGFRRVAFYRDWIFAVFDSTTSAANAVSAINTDTKMRASFARDEYAPNYVVPEPGMQCSVLYVCNLPWDATNLELTKLFKAYPGYREVYFFREACKVYFEDIDSAESCMRDVNATTNLIATYFKGETASGQSGMIEDQARDEADAISVKSARSAADVQGSQGVDSQGGQSGEGRPTPKCTLHVSNLTRDRADLKVHFQSYAGFVRIAYYPNWIFLVFADSSTAAQAIQKIHATTRMQASFAQVEYTPGFVRPEPGPMGPVVRVGNFPSGAGEGEFVKLFRSYENCTDVRFGREDCLIWFSSREAATRCLDDINRTTNLCAVYYPVMSPAATQPPAARLPTATPQTGFSPYPSQQSSGPPPGFGQFQPRPVPQQTEFWEDDEPATLSMGHSIPSSPGGSSLDASAARSSASSPFPNSERSYGVEGIANNGHNVVVGPTGQMAVSGMSAGYGGGSGFPPGHPPKTTLKIGNISLDRADLRKVLSSLRGFTKVAFYRDYVYACFADVECARAAMDLLHTSSRMRCVYPKYDYTTHNDRLDVGQPCPILHVSNMPFNSNSSEFVKMFGAYEGYRETQFFRESCLVFFATERDAATALQDLNKTTNLVVVYSKKGLSALQALQQGSLMTYANGSNSLSGYPGGDFQHSLPTDPALMEQFLRSVSASMSDQFEGEVRRPPGSSNLTGGSEFPRDRRTSEADSRLWTNGFGRSPSMPLSSFASEGDEDGEYKRYARTPDSMYQADNASGGGYGTKSNEIPDVVRHFVEKMQHQMSEMEQRMVAMQRQLAERAVAEQRLKEENAQLRAALTRLGGGRAPEIRRSEQVSGRGGLGRFTPELNVGSPVPSYGSALGLTRSTSGPPQRNVGFAQYAEDQFYAQSPTSSMYPPQAQQFRAGQGETFPGHSPYGAYQPQLQHTQGPPSYELTAHDSIISMLDTDIDRQEARRQQQQQLQQQQTPDYDPREAWNSVTFGPQATQGAESGPTGLGGMGRGFGTRFGNNGSIW